MLAYEIDVSWPPIAAIENDAPDGVQADYSDGGATGRVQNDSSDVKDGAHTP
jgi:hypothetical protein